MQELRLVAVSEDGTYLVLATAGRGTRFTLPVDDRLRAAVRGNFSRLGQYEIEVESPLRPKEIQARIRAGETAEEIAMTAGIPVERVRWFEGPVLQEREYMAQQAQRCAVRLPGDTSPGPILGDLVAERLSRRGVPADEIDWDSAKRDDGLWRVKLGFVWNGHTRNAEWLFDPRRRHISPNDDEAMRLSASEYVEPAPDTTVTPFVPRVAKLQPVPPLAPPVPFPSVIRHDPPAMRLEAEHIGHPRQLEQPPLRRETPGPTWADPAAPKIIPPDDEPGTVPAARLSDEGPAGPSRGIMQNLPPATAHTTPATAEGDHDMGDSTARTAFPHGDTPAIGTPTAQPPYGTAPTPPVTRPSPPPASDFHTRSAAPVSDTASPAIGGARPAAPLHDNPAHGFTAGRSPYDSPAARPAAPSASDRFGARSDEAAGGHGSAPTPLYGTPAHGPAADANRPTPLYDSPTGPAAHPARPDNVPAGGPAPETPAHDTDPPAGGPEDVRQSQPEAGRAPLGEASAPVTPSVSSPKDDVAASAEPHVQQSASAPTTASPGTASPAPAASTADSPAIVPPAATSPSAGPSAAVAPPADSPVMASPAAGPPSEVSPTAEPTASSPGTASPAASSADTASPAAGPPSGVSPTAEPAASSASTASPAAESAADVPPLAASPGMAPSADATPAAAQDVAASPTDVIPAATKEVPASSGEVATASGAGEVDSQSAKDASDAAAVPADAAQAEAAQAAAPPAATMPATPAPAATTPATPAGDQAGDKASAVPAAEETPAAEPAQKAGDAVESPQEPAAAAAKAEPKPDPAPAAPAKPAPGKQAAEKGGKGKAAADKTSEPPQAPPAPAQPTRPARRSRGRRASVPSWDEIMFGARRQD
ncbi:septation protein SepH [Sinosporangium siamense]|uniref:DUF3071 domain-containing protein n=1 Tax=Sinosporangium siamense TaxID=1367973 RepID=A0A919RFR8_9ACTN|nr:septation protein SepH [Sinosporangium siamense]GII91970.1 hypothetical protein Ssi02_22010 [Sinosporangium siamense]